jgi:hypothetical protein
MMAKFEVGDGVTIKAIVNDVTEHGLVSIAVASQTVAEYKFWVEPSDIVQHFPMTLEQRLAGLTLDQIAKALSREDTALADAIEMAGAKIAKTRRESGEMRRERKPKAEAPPSAPNDAETSSASVAAIAGLEVTSYSLAKMAAKQGGKALDGYLYKIGEDAREEIREFVPEFLEIADAVDAEIAAKDKAARADGMQATAKVDIPF